MGSADIDPARLSLPVDGVLVLWCTPMAPDTAARLSPGHDQERVARLRMADDRSRSLTAAWLLRQLAGAALGIDPRDVTIDRTCRCGRPHGRPHVGIRGVDRPVGGRVAVVSRGTVDNAGDDRYDVVNRGGVDVSVTHAGSVVGVAATRRGRVGLDVEPREAFAGERADDVLRTAAAPAELAWVRSRGDAGPAGVEVAAGRLWVRKEAILKATGHGLAQDPRTVFLDQARGVLTGWPFPEPVASAHLFDLDPELVPGSPYLGALALLDSPPAADHLTTVRRSAPLMRVVRVVRPDD